ncbi:hypothetical protein DENIS_4691 [Desulfonema ishimotonii]|uniref:LysM domain-containing protein n=2 Tax=Desulfonema ishimotonii TaxID=45657 RepID=A0A401G3C3_9BACT|nr:hypothetical protein DENIS_4691 [Desulfonema ishimotonii]
MAAASSAFATDNDTVTFIVRPGDNLVTICEGCLEDPRNWDEVAEINNIRDPNRLWPGMEILVPVRLLRGTPVAATVTFLKGEVLLKSPETEIWTPLSAGDSVPEGSRVKTGEQSAVELTCEDGSTLFLRDQTETGILKALRKGPSYLVHDIFVRAGRAIAHVRKLLKGGTPRFRIHTRTGVAGVRGTTFRTSVDPSENSRFEVLEGTVGVNAMRDQVMVEQGEGTLVSRGRKPTPPKKLLPPPVIRDFRPLYKRLPLRLHFDSVEGAVACRVMIAKDAAFKDVVFEKQVPPNEPVRILDIEDGSYYLQTRSIDDLGLNGLPSRAEPVQIRVNPLPPFVNTPEDGSEYRGDTVTFKWLKVAGATSYHVQVAEGADFQAVVTDRDDVSGSEYRVRVPDYKTWYFRIRSGTDDGYKGDWSDTLAFTTIPPPPQPPVETPEVGDEIIKIRWGDLGDGITYHFQMAKDAEFREILLDRKPEKPETSFEKPETPGVYYIRTSGIDATGYEGAFSIPQSFEVEKGFPYELLGIIAGFALLIAL